MSQLRHTITIDGRVLAYPGDRLDSAHSELLDRILDCLGAQEEEKEDEEARRLDATLREVMRYANT